MFAVVFLPIVKAVWVALPIFIATAVAVLIKGVKTDVAIVKLPEIDPGMPIVCPVLPNVIAPALVLPMSKAVFKTPQSIEGAVAVSCIFDGIVNIVVVRPNVIAEQVFEPIKNGIDVFVSS